MDRQTLIVMGGFFGVMIGSALINNLTADPFLRAYAFPLMMVVFIGSIVGQEMLYRLAAAELLCVRLTIRPSGETLWLWVKHLEAEEFKNGNFAWKFNLAFPSRELAPYGRIKSMIINAPIHANKAIRWGPGEVLYKETQIKHARMTQITVDQQSRTATSVERGYALPIFYLRESTYFIKEGVINNIGDVELQKQNESLTRANEQLRALNATEHDGRLREQEVNEQLQTELQTLRGLHFAVKKLAIISIVTLLHLVETFDEVVKALGGRAKQNIAIKGLALAVAIIAVFMFFYTQPQMWPRLEAWLTTPMNQVYLLLIIVAVAGTLYVIRRRMRRFD